MYRRDHPPPHVHVGYGEFELILGLPEGNVLAGYLPKRQLREARAVCSERGTAWLKLFYYVNPPRHA
jgi:hypothetical protein